MAVIGILPFQRSCAAFQLPSAWRSISRVRTTSDGPHGPDEVTDFDSGVTGNGRDGRKRALLSPFGTRTIFSGLPRSVDF
jgi:hypothetical protein